MCMHLCGLLYLCLIYTAVILVFKMCASLMFVSLMYPVWFFLRGPSTAAGPQDRDHKAKVAMQAGEESATKAPYSGVDLLFRNGT